ncbi:MAG: winged helix-turn-helix transcriptional regulator, partial [Deltaproteobacteria bacterium]|nr:winged helix-turn-helix transcriptional regulator [Deltaproteobacteria bacterium]
MLNLFSGLISSKTRIKLLTRFFFNPQTRSYLRELAREFNVSTNLVRQELNRLTKTNLLKFQKDGRQVYYMANEDHPLFPELKSMVSKVMGIDQVIDGIVNRLGDLERVYLIDDYA